jgi:hypothetical protein
MKHVLFLFFISLSLYSLAQSSNDLPVRTPYKLRLAVKKGSVYEMEVAATPYVQQESIVQIYPGETLYLEAEEKDGRLSLKSVKAIQDSSKTIMVSCVQNISNGKHEGVMLKVSNPFNRSLIYTARMFLLSSNKWVATDVIPVEAKLFGIEMWPDVVISFGLSDWQLSSK